MPLFVCYYIMSTNNPHNTSFALLSEWLEKKGFYFFGLYQVFGAQWQFGRILGMHFLFAKILLRLNRILRYYFISSI